MSYAFDSRLGEQLYQLLPELYRTRDRERAESVNGSGNEDLARYLDAHGHLLDLMHATLEQQLGDTLPDSSQDWLLPYFAQLLAASALSPHPEGRQAEIANAVPWRQRKGTLRCVEEIAEAVADTEVEIQEGWQRVAITPRIGKPLLDPEIIDSTLSIDMNVPAQVNRHPGLPVVHVDLRQYSRAVEALPVNPAARTSDFGGERKTWRQTSVHGVPCFPDSFEDVSRRTVDLRTHSLRGSRYHHKTLLAHVPPPTGMFPIAGETLAWDQRGDSVYEHLFDEYEESGVLVIRNCSGRRVQIEGNVSLDDARPYRLENLDFLNKLTVDGGGSLELRSVEAEDVEVTTASTTEPVLTAVDCLFGKLSVGSGLAELDSCTSLGESHLRYVSARDCIFESVGGADESITGVIQNCRIPVSPAFSTDREKLELKNHVTDSVVYFSGSLPLAARGVLAPGTPASITAGALDGGEMGYYHRGRSRGVVTVPGERLGADKLDIPLSGFRLWQVVFPDPVEVDGGPLVFENSAAVSMLVGSTFRRDESGVVPVIDASDSIFDTLEVATGLARLEYCTVMGLADCRYLQASDSLFAGSIAGVRKPPLLDGQPEFENCLRFSALPGDMLADIASKPKASPERRLADALRLLDSDGQYLPGSNTLAAPIFIKVQYCEADDYTLRHPDFADPGYGVLSLHASPDIRFGAEDGGEMGATHCLYYSLKAEASLEKLAEFLPVGIEPKLLLDSRLWQPPPEIDPEETGD